MVGNEAGDLQNENTPMTPGDTARAAAELLAPLTVRPPAMPGFERLTRRPPRHKVICYVSLGGASSESFRIGLQAAAGMLGWTVTTLTYDPQNPGYGVAAVDRAIQACPLGIVLVGIDPARIRPQVAQAQAADIAMVAFSNPSRSVEGPAYVNTTELQEHQDLAAISLMSIAAAQESGHEAHIVVVSTEFPLLQRVAGQIGASVQGYSPGCTANVLNVPSHDYFAGRSAPHVLSYIQSHPETNVVLFLLGQYEGELIQALKRAGLPDVKVVGVVPTPAQIQEVRAGDAFAWVLAPIEYHTWSIVDVFARASVGMDWHVHDDVRQPLWVVTQDEVKQLADISALPDFPAGYKDEFLRLWQVR